MNICLRFIVFLSITFCSIYDVGEQVSSDHQNRQFDICYGAEEHGYGDEFAPNLSLAEFNGFNNGGLFYVTMIDMAASW